ncbi:SDR family NAD(P)-dependent oxidoreductase [Belliella aquatica]|uniref:3-oxoacyl-ACP reductase n=1 Tax=Belliella aquatica TaxID=1323734 RepID=A0ABQ1MP84_9BACT|nr:SDR family oxidoreductase [Belliella aquatica]MCH7405008.1 SDR family oxidoreductase [Belliella aquatica]GGC40592.1 3-oxoacyl-ACP reductase [Belliella aquatica]
MNQHTQKIAIVTGGASGLGLATSQKFVKEGIKTIIIGRDQNKLDDVKTQLGDLAYTIAFDLSDLEKIPELIESIKGEFGQIDILVNNAGINMKKNFLEVTDEDFYKVMNTNVFSVFAISREVSKVMVEQGDGSIVMISSMAAKYGIPKVIAYTAAKNAIEGMTKAMAVELSPLGIRVNCVAPGFIVTAMSSKALDSDPERKNKVLGRTPMGKMGAPEDVAEAVYYFASSSSSYVTGTSLAVDGGNSIGF